MAAEREAEILDYLDRRELVTVVYKRTRRPVATLIGRVSAWCYVVRREHEQYAGVLDRQRTLELVRQATGHCTGYLVSTVAPTSRPSSTVRFTPSPSTSPPTQPRSARARE